MHNEIKLGSKIVLKKGYMPLNRMVREGRSECCHFSQNLNDKNVNVIGKGTVGR